MNNEIPKRSELRVVNEFSNFPVLQDTEGLQVWSEARSDLHGESGYSLSGKAKQ